MNNHDTITELKPSAISNNRTSAMLKSALGVHIQEYLKDDSIVEIMLDPNGHIWCERLGTGLFDTGNSLSQDSAMRVIKLIASATDQVCNEEKPSLQASLPETGERFQAGIPPISYAPFFAIRKKALKVFTISDYVDSKIISQEQASKIKDAVISRKNLLIVGGTSSGKTTLLNAVLNEMAKTKHRIITIEDTPELQCTAKSYVPLYVKYPLYTMQDAVKDTMRLNPERIVVGEIRDGSALDLLKAWNTGHGGGIATVHADSAIKGLSRLKSLLGEATANPDIELIADTIDMVIFIMRTNEGIKVKEIIEVNGLDERGKYIIS